MSQLTINLKAVQDNYKTLKSKVSGACEVSCVVKANAYGLGVAAIAPILQNAGCKTFFVATLPEALELRMILEDLNPSATIAMLNGFQAKNADMYRQASITPVLNDRAELYHYKDLASRHDKKLPAILHIDTAMNRLGINMKDAEDLATDPTHFEGLNMKAIISHFASADEKDSDLNNVQHDRFKTIAQLFPDIPKSLCNSSGMFLNSAYHHDLVRPGMALYGLNPTPHASNPMQPAVKIDAEILQIHSASKNETAGYNETHRFSKKTNVAVVSVGYADGFLRAFSNKGRLYWNNIPCPIRGNVSMDLTIVDLCDIPDNQMPNVGDTLEIIGEKQSADDLARDAQTIGYEILTSLSRRYERKYLPV